MNTKTVETVLPKPAPHMVGDGFRVHNFLPGRLGFRRMSPFLLLDYGARAEIPPSPEPRGVGAHPHRGFETVTLAFEGKVAHHDSAGNSGVIEEGDVQWMTAGAGILHKEYHEEAWARKGGTMQMVQLWVNLPAKDKLTPPKYQAITRASHGVHALPDGAGRVEVVAGAYKEARGPASTFTPVQLYKVFLEPGGKAEFALPAVYNTGLLVLDGKVVVNGSGEVTADSFALLGKDGEVFTVEALEKSVLLVLSGEPIEEPIAAYGPFVMNTEEEIHQAVEDFHRGKFGRLE